MTPKSALVGSVAVPGPYTLRDRGHVFTFDPVGKRIAREHRLWKSQHESWSADRFHTVEVLQTMYKGAEWYALQLVGVDTENRALELPILVGGREPGVLADEGRRVGERMGFAFSERKWTDPRPQWPTASIDAESLANAMGSYFAKPRATPQKSEPVVAKCRSCSLSTLAATGTPDDPVTGLPMAQCPYCGDIFPYGGLEERRVSVPAQIKDVVVESGVKLVAIGWSDRGGSFGCRIVDVAEGTDYDLDLDPALYPDLRIQAVDRGRVVAFSGVGVYDEDLEARVFSVDGIHVFDARSNRPLWHRALADKPALTVSQGLVTLDWSGDSLTNAHPEWPTETLDLATGEPATAAQLANRQSDRDDVNRARVFPEMGGTSPGEPLFDRWSQTLERRLGLTPRMRMSVLHHNGYDIVNAHCVDGDGATERLVIFGSERIVSNVALRGVELRGSHGTAFDWNLTGFWVDGSLLIVQSAANEMVFVRLTRS